MSPVFTEALLEMHFHYAIKGFFQKTFGARFLRLLKPSARREAWVGFDQGWVRIEVEPEQFYEELRQAIQSRSSLVDRFYLGFFLQFKRVRRVTRRGRYMPAQYRLPYYRSELSLKPNRSTGLSQHETLLRLSHINSASVCYACPMLLHSDEIYEDPDLERLRCIDVLAAPARWRSDERHFITFQHPADEIGLWCSEPVDTRVFSFEEWASPRRENRLRRLSAQETLGLIRDAVEELRTPIIGPRTARAGSYVDVATRLLPESFTVAEFVGSGQEMEAD